MKLYLVFLLLATFLVSANQAYSQGDSTFPEVVKVRGIGKGCKGFKKKDWTYDLSKDNEGNKIGVLDIKFSDFQIKELSPYNIRSCTLHISVDNKQKGYTYYVYTSQVFGDAEVEDDEVVNVTTKLLRRKGSDVEKIKVLEPGSHTEWETDPIVYPHQQDECDVKVVRFAFLVSINRELDSNSSKKKPTSTATVNQRVDRILKFKKVKCNS